MTAPAVPARRWARGALALVAAGTGALGFVPLFGGPGYEAALGAGLLVPGIVGAGAALAAVGAGGGSGAGPRGSRAGTAPGDDSPPGASDRAGARPSGATAALAQGVELGLGATAVTVLAAWLHGLRVPLCDPWNGTLALLLGPGVGAVLAGALGGLAGWALPARVRRRRALAALALGLAAPLGGMLISLWRFWSSAMVYAFDPFFGYLAGPLYDTVVDPVGPLLGYRVGTAATLLALVVLARVLDERTAPPSTSPQAPGRWLVRALGVAAALGSLAHAAQGARLGHYTTDASLGAALDREVLTTRCRVRHSPDVPADEAALLGRDCDAQVAAVERWLEARGPERITVWLFASTGEKARFMGAAGTQVAKPWRHEIYVQASGFPHPVLGHELAHALAASVGQGPFRVAGPLGGWVPDPGRIEGLAEAAAPDDDDLTLAEWARAMRDAGILPPVERVFRLSFLGVNASQAYTVAGAFVAWLHDAHGAAAVRRWYGGEPLLAITGRDLAALDADFRASLDQVALDPRALAVARARFERPAIFGRRCPRRVDALDGEANARLGARDPKGARALYDRVLALDPAHFWARMGLARCEQLEGRLPEAAARFAALAEDATFPVATRWAAREALGDQLLTDAPRVEAGLGAAPHLQAVLEATPQEDRRRTLQVKLIGAQAPPTSAASRAVAELLVGDPRLGRDPLATGAALGRWVAEAPTDPVPRYLLGRNLTLAGRWAEGAAWLESSRGLVFPTPELAREALRQRLIAACALGQAEAVERAAAELATADQGGAGGRARVARLLARCR